MMIKMMMMKNPPGPYINHMLESHSVKRRALSARRLERLLINIQVKQTLLFYAPYVKDV